MDPPPGLVDALDAVAERIRAASAAIGDEVRVDPLAELAVRATTHGFNRRGRISCGGATRLLRCADGWLAISLARDEDVSLVPALVEAEVDDAWAAATDWCATQTAADAEARGALLGLPLAAVGSSTGAGAVEIAEVGPARVDARPLVVDLSSLWAGPLCGALLARAGLDVLKLESVGRPDGSRLGPAAFFDHVNGAKRSATFDARPADGRRQLLDVVRSATVVIEASRPRALEQLGVHRDALDDGPQIWLSITAHGRRGASGERVGFGDDTAAAGGLVMWQDGPLFCADAIADPITGLVAAAHVLEVLAAVDGRRRQIDLSMSAIAATFVGQ